MGREAALLWESGWGFSMNVGHSDTLQWRKLTGMLSTAAAHDSGLIDGAIAEVTSTRLVQRSAMPVLYYAAPVSATRDAQGRIASVALATKAGLQSL